MDWSVTKGVTIPEGAVKRILRNGDVLWQKESAPVTLMMGRPPEPEPEEPELEEGEE